MKIFSILSLLHELQTNYPSSEREYVTIVIWCFKVVRLSPKDIPIFFFDNLQFRDYHFHGGREDRLCG